MVAINKLKGSLLELPFFVWTFKIAKEFYHEQENKRKFNATRHIRLFNV